MNKRHLNTIMCYLQNNLTFTRTEEDNFGYFLKDYTFEVISVNLAICKGPFIVVAYHQDYGDIFDIVADIKEGKVPHASSAFMSLDRYCNEPNSKVHVAHGTPDLAMMEVTLKLREKFLILQG